MAKNTEKKTVAIIIALAVAILIAVIIFSVSIVKAIKNESTDSTTQYTLQSAQTTVDNNVVTDNGVVSTDFVLPSSSDVSSSETSGVTNSATNSNTSTTKGTEKTTSAETTEYDPIAAYENLEKQGEAYASADPNNKYIKKIADKYDVDPALLVVLYSEPTSGENVGTNFVLEFDGTKDSSGNYVKSPDTLKKVYHIDKDGDISVTQGKMTGNIGVSYADGMLVFNMVKVILMPKYPDFFTGV